VNAFDGAGRGVDIIGVECAAEGFGAGLSHYGPQAFTATEQAVAHSRDKIFIGDSAGVWQALGQCLIDT
jgi:hypothetical protein